MKKALIATFLFTGSLIPSTETANSLNSKFLKACFAGSKDEISICLAEGANINHVFQDRTDQYSGATPLLLVCMTEEPEAVSFLLEKGALINKASDNGLTPLIAACIQKNSALVKQLLKASADPNYSTNPKLTPLKVACRDDLHSMAKILIEAGAHVNDICVKTAHQEETKK